MGSEIDGSIPIDRRKWMAKKTNCNMYKGSWRYDKSYPMYHSSACPFIRPEFACLKYGRPNHRYLKYRWQPTQCDIPRFDGKNLLRRLRGKRVMYVGDSVSNNHWTSMVCLLHAAVPQSNITLSTADPISTVTFQDYGVSISIFRSPYLVDINKEKIGRVLKLNSLKKGKTWKKFDVLIFNTWLWWYRAGTSQPWDYIKYKNITVKDMNRMDAFRRGLMTWGNWVESNVNTSKTKVFFTGISPSHYNGREWNEPGVTNCANETRPLGGSTYPGGSPLALGVLKKVLSGMSKRVELLDITLLSQLRKDGHPSIYNKFRGMDCTHWCVAGVTDTWNQLLYSALL